MPICCDCRIDQPHEAFSAESQPLCESCYQRELEEEAAGGEVGNDAAADGDDDDDQESARNALETGAVDRVGIANYNSDDENDDEETNRNNKKPRKIIPFASAARLLNPQGELLDREEPPDGETGPPDVALLEPLVQAVYERGYSNGLGLDSRQVLHYRLKRVLFTPHDDEDDDYDASNDVLSWLTRPLVHALLEGPQSSYQQIRVAPLNVKETVIDPQTLLHWLCQWKLLLLQCGWKGHDDMVDLLICAGASVDATLTNGCTPLFFAVKYGSVDTVRLLHQAGANLSHRDCRKQTCLRNALPQASPYILKYLLQHGVAVDETFWAQAVDKSSPKTRINALDILVTEFVAPNPDVSWVTLGMASVDDYALCMILLLQKGLQISPHYYDVQYFLGQYLQGSIKAPKRLYYTRYIADLLFGQWLPIAAKEELSIVAKTSRDDDMDEIVTNENGASLGASSGCHLCRNQTNKSSSPPVTLFCHHQFCRDCIVEYTKTALLDLPEESTNTSSNFQSRPRVIGCPTCRHPLGKDLTQEQPSSGPQLGEESSTNHTVDKTTKRNRLEQKRLGLSKLAMEQLQFECEARNLVVAKKELKEHCVESIVHDWQDFTVPQEAPNEDDDDDDDDETEIDDSSSGSRLMAELTLSNTMISEDNYLWVAPSLGSVMIPITVKGVPIFALLSTTAPCTVVSPRFVQTFEFELNSNLQMTASNPLKFVRAEDDEQKMNHNYDRPVNNNPDEAPPRPKPKVITAPSVHLTAVKDFSFTLGKSGIQVDLPSAVQACEPHTHSWPVGVILGRDFVQSAAWMQLSVEVDLEVCLGRTVALLTCNNTNTETEVEPRLEFDLIAPRRASHVEEDLRYYSRDGKVFWTPLWHIRLSEHDSCISIGQYLKELLPLPGKQNTAGMPKASCAWCCREFPSVVTSKTRGFLDCILSRPPDSGMLQCPLCYKGGDRNESSNGNHTPTYYCDEKCQQQAQYIHSLRNHNGMDLTKYCGEKREMRTSYRFKAVIILISVLVVLMGILAHPGTNSANDSTGVAPYTVHNMDNIELSDMTDEQSKTKQEDEL